MSFGFKMKNLIWQNIFSWLRLSAKGHYVSGFGIKSHPLYLQGLHHRAIYIAVEDYVQVFHDLLGQPGKLSFVRQWN